MRIVTIILLLLSICTGTQSIGQSYLDSAVISIIGTARMRSGILADDIFIRSDYTYSRPGGIDGVTCKLLPTDAFVIYNGKANHITWELPPANLSGYGRVYYLVNTGNTLAGFRVAPADRLMTPEGNVYNAPVARFSHRLLIMICDGTDKWIVLSNIN